MMPNADLDALLARFPSATVDLVRRVRALVFDVRSDAVERVWSGWKNVGYGVGSSINEFVCVVSPAKSWVRLSFPRTDLPDPSGLLAGAAGMPGRNLRLGSPADVDRPELRALIAAGFAAGGQPMQARTVPRARAAGAFVAGVSKTVDVPIETLYEAWRDDEVRRRWLPEPFAVRKATPNRSLRIMWADRTSVEALFIAKGAHKSVVQIDHTKLADDEMRVRIVAFWKERLAVLKSILES